MNKQDLPTTRTFRWSAVFSTNMPFNLSTERRSINAFGTKTWKLLETPLPNVAQLRPLDESITVRPISLVASAPKRLQQVFEIPEFTITGKSIDAEKSYGYVELDTGRFSYQFEISLTRDVLPILTKLGLPDFRLLVREGGILPLANPEADMVDAYGQYFLLRSKTPSEDLNPPNFLGSFKKDGSPIPSPCETAAELTANVSGDGVRPSDLPPNGMVWICPGTSVDLFWDYTDDVTHAEISPDIGVLTTAPGMATVTPATTTTYSLTVEGKCIRTEEVTVVVLGAGDTADLILPYDEARSQFYLNIPSEFAHPDVRVTSLRPACITGCFVHTPPIHGYPYMDCGGAPCNGAWNLSKRDPDGHSSFYSMWNNLVPVANRPLAGEYAALPQEMSSQMFGNAYFIATLACE